MVTQPSIPVLRGIVTSFHALAVISTTFRLGYRFKIRRLWWDDAFAALAVVLSFLNIAALWIRTDVPGVGPLNRSRHARIIAYWLVSICFTSVLWISRLSILLSIIRIIPAISNLYRVAQGSVILFVFCWAFLMGQKIYVCTHDRAWLHLHDPQCHLGRGVGIAELVTDVISDAILLWLPMRLLWKLSMTRSRYRLLLAIFSASILTTIVSIVHAVFLLGPSGLLEALTANVESATSMIVSSLAVVVSWFYRLIKRETSSNYDHDNDDEVYVASSAGGTSNTPRRGRSTHRNRSDNSKGSGAGVISTLRFWHGTSGKITDTVLSELGTRRSASSHRKGPNAPGQAYDVFDPQAVYDRKRDAADNKLPIGGNDTDEPPSPSDLTFVAMSKVDVSNKYVAG
ncbi:hypothetical protein DENSPDRAFT_351499 [Dentipellis sp. KUC8613]|nr:hypothetical protein DENSPDRAFT_351499 [Dentipellis sp. KUC8613]